MFLLSSQNPSMKLRINKITSLLVLLTLLFLPFQLGKHFWPTFTYVIGQRVDYLSPTMYISDIPLLFLFILHGKMFLKHIGIWFYAILLFLSLGIFFSSSPMSGWYGLVKFVELVFFGWLLAQYGNKLFSALFWIFGLDMLLEGILGIMEFGQQSSINGFWYFFGERNFNATTPGIANAAIHGQSVLRPYGTFSHPNVFAGYIVISLLLFLTTVLFTKEKIKKIVAFIFLVFGSLILFLTLSRVAVVVWIAFLLVGLLIRFGKRVGAFLSGLIGLLVALLFFTPFFSGRFLDSTTYIESFDLRLILQQAAINMWTHSPIFGVGINNFLIALPSFIQGHVLFGFLQPVHNIFLLVLAETGLIGLGVFCTTLVIAFTNNLRIVKQSLSQISLFVFLSLCAIIAIGFTDHYFLTLQQGQLLFAFILGLSFSHGTIRVWPFIKNLLRIQSTK